MNKVTIYTDGSYTNSRKIKRAGISFLYLFSDSQEQIIGYSRIPIYNISSTNAEVLAIIYSLKYLISLNIECDCIEIMCDEVSIVNFLNNKEYIVYQKRGWKKASGQPINSRAEQLYELTCLVNSFPEDKLIFAKANKTDMGNEITHSYARIAAKSDTPNKNSLYIEKRMDMNSEFSSTQVINFSKIEQEVACTVFVEDIKPWKKIAPPSKAKDKKESDRHILWLDVIDKDIVSINTADIVLTEDVHLKCQKLNFEGNLKKCAKNMTIDTPIAVRKINDDKYSLVMGITRLFIAKILAIPTIPCIVTELDYNEFKQKYDI